jgi:5-methylcytosine-specific restriction endonuclease McrA
VPDDEIEIDHIIPHAKGGPTRPDNLRLLCRKCNRKKSDSVSLLLNEFAAANAKPVGTSSRKP